MELISDMMIDHPDYLEQFIRTYNYILRGDGPISYDFRYIIAILAAGRHQCGYLMDVLKNEYLLYGGNSSWLLGLQFLPRKLQNLYELNKILAHRPWLLNKSHIQNLTRGSDNWSLSELLHAIIILVHFHSLSSFVFSCGINKVNDVPETPYESTDDDAEPVNPRVPSNSPEHVRSNYALRTSSSSPSVVGEQEVKVETLVMRMKDIIRNSKSYEIDPEELAKRFQTVEKQSAELEIMPQQSDAKVDTDIKLFVEDPDFIYQDFSKRGQGNGAPTFRVQDYSWDDQGYSLVNGLYNEVGGLLDDKFRTAYNLTYNTMGEHRQVDTSRFRIAIWNYIQSLYGIKHDDYDYNEVNQLLERSLKTFIKNAVCYPERVTSEDYDQVMTEFKPSEKVHVNLIILEARLQAELLYALRSMMRFMT